MFLRVCANFFALETPPLFLFPTGNNIKKNREYLLHLADIYSDRYHKVKDNREQDLSLKGRKRLIQRRAKESKAAEEIERSITIINKGVSQDKKMEKCRKAMLDELDSTQTDEEDKGQEPTISS